MRPRPTPQITYRHGAGLALAMSLSLSSALAEESIVGRWATPGRCAVPLSVIEIEPKRLSGEDFFCDFDSVSRRKDIVSWKGQCVFGADRPQRTPVTARLDGTRLWYRIGPDAWNGPLERCRKPSQ